MARGIKYEYFNKIYSLDFVLYGFLIPMSA